MKHGNHAVARKFLAVLLGSTITGAVLVATAVPATAATITVTTTKDQFGGGAACSLREAIEAADTNNLFGGCPAGVGPDEIVLAEGTYTLTRANAGGTTENANQSGDLDVHSDITFLGVGAYRTVVDGNGSELHDRVFDLWEGRVTMFRLSVMDGFTAANGGGIRAIAGVTLDRAAVRDNHAGTTGGGIDTFGDLEIVDSFVNRNSAETGGGIFAQPFGEEGPEVLSVRVLRSQLWRNSARRDGGGLVLGNRVEGTLRHARVTENSAKEDGGGILVSSQHPALNSTLNLTRSTLFGNSAYDDGGAISMGLGSDDLSTAGSFWAIARIRRTTIRGNSSGDFGGAIDNAGGDLTVQRSTIDHNDAYLTRPSNVLSPSGGGIAIREGGVADIVNTTISGNEADTHGGGLYVETGGSDGPHSVFLNNSTVSRNIADANDFCEEDCKFGTQGGGGGDGDGGSGGGIAVRDFQTDGAGTSGEPPPEVILANTILGGNRDLGGEAPDCFGTVGSFGYNLVRTNKGCNFISNTGDQVGTPGNPIDPKLEPLLPNGGGDWTHALRPNSPAVDAGNPADPDTTINACEDVDERGVPRPQGERCDIGAFELED